jgi:hypothetical protein
MKPRLIALAACVAGCLHAAGAAATASDPAAYVLAAKSSTFTYGCFGPCLCPVYSSQPLEGGFTLRLAGVSPLFVQYDVTDVWLVAGATAPEAVTFTGSGTFRTGGEVAVVQQLVLDLSANGGPVQRFDSGLVPAREPFPAIDDTLSLHGVWCFDSVLVVRAQPQAPASLAGPPVAGLRALPNPFRAATRIGFGLSRPGPVRCSVLDVSGRVVRTLAAGEPRPPGEQWLEWDGRRDDGVPAPPGLYFARVDGPDGRATRTLVRLR